MTNVIIVEVKYKKSGSFWEQGKGESMGKFSNKGYSCIRAEHGNWLFAKGAAVLVTVKDEAEKQKEYDMKDSIQDYYRAKKISKKLANRFEEEFLGKRVGLEFKLMSGGTMVVSRFVLLGS